MLDENIIAVEPVIMSAHGSMQGSAAVTYQAYGVIEAHGTMRLNENGVKLFREIIDDEEIQRSSPKLIEFLKEYIDKHLTLTNLKDLSVLVANISAINEKFHPLQHMYAWCQSAIEFMSQFNSF